MALNAGSAYSEYRLKYDGFLKDLQAVEAAYERLQSRFERAEAPAIGGDTRGARQAAELARINATVAQQQARAQQAQAQASTVAEVASARLAVAQNAAAISAQRLAQAEQGTVTATQRAAAAAAQAAAAQDRAAVAAQRRAQAEAAGTSGLSRSAALTDAFKGSILELAGSFGVATTAAGGVVIAAQQLGAAFDLRAQLVGTQQQFRTLFGDVDAANAKIDQAAAFAEKYKIRQTEVNAALAEAAPLLRDSTASTEQQLSALTRLGSLNAAEGINGAVFALKELTAASTEGEAILSLVDRFNISKDAARGLFQEVQAGGDVFVALDRVLNDLNVTNETLVNRTVGIVGAQNAAAKATEDLQLAVGAFVEGPGASLLQFYANATSASASFVARLAGQGNQFTANAAQVAATAPTYDAYVASINAANTATGAAVTQQQGLLGALNAVLPGFSGMVLGATQLTAGTNALTASQFAYVQAQVAAGVAAEQAIANAEAQAGALALVDTAIINAGGALDEYQGRLAAVAAAGQGETDAVQALVLAFTTGGLSAEQFAVQLARLEQASLIAAQAKRDDALAADEAAAATLYSADAAQNDALAKLDQATQTELANLQTQQLVDALQLAAGGSETAGAAAARLAGIYQGTEAPALERIIGLLREKAALEGRGAARALGNVGSGRQAAADVANRRLEYQRNLQTEIVRATGSTAQQLALVNQQLAAAPRYSEEALRLEGERARLQARMRQEEAQGARSGGARGGGGSGGGRSAAVRAAEREQAELQRIEEKRTQIAQDVQGRLEELERDHGERLAAIQAQYLKAQQEAEKKLRTSSLNSRASFYDTLTQSTGDIGQPVAQALSAAYEQAFAEAQKLAQEGKAALGAEFLALRQEQLQEELAYQQAVAEARAKGDEAEVQRLAAIEELRRQAREEELKQLLEGGDANVEARDEATADEAQNFAEKATEIADAGEAKTAKLEAQELRAQTALAATNTLMAEQARLRALGEGAAPARPSLPEAQAQAAATPAAGGGAGATGGGAPVLVDYPALFAQVVTLGAAVDRLAGTSEAQSGQLASLITATGDNARAIERLSVRAA